MILGRNIISSAPTTFEMNDPVMLIEISMHAIENSADARYMNNMSPSPEKFGMYIPTNTSLDTYPSAAPPITSAAVTVSTLSIQLKKTHSLVYGSDW